MHADNRFERVRAAMEQLGPADHVCTLYDQRDEEVAIAVSYIRAGLDRGELCVCVVDDGGESILDALASEGVDIDAEMRKGLRRGTCWGRSSSMPASPVTPAMPASGLSGK